MGIVMRTETRVLLGIPADDLAVIMRALEASAADAALPDGVRAPAHRCLDELRRTLDECPLSREAERTDAWADGASVQVRAINVWGDPVDLGVDEAQNFLAKLSAAVREADG